METTKESQTDNELLERFKQEILSKVPHLEEENGKKAVVNPTPLTDITDDLKECAKNVYSIDLADSDLRVFGKFDSKLFGGSVKMRPAVHIIHDAILTGRLDNGRTVIEATSGNFGIALGLLSRLGVDVVALVSRKLQEGVFEELRNERTRIMNLDMDICPAPGMKENQDAAIAKATAANVRSQLVEMGFDPTVFDNASSDAESLLAKQDIINLARFLARIYGCFCPAQYDNELNIDVHKTVTGPEIDQQLQQAGETLGDYKIVCTFGTGGTSGGLSRYASEKYGKKAVHVVFPPENQDVAGIRTKGKASGLTYYEPEIYAGQHEADFEQAKHLLKFFADKGYDIGESSALALYSVIQMANFGAASKFVVMIADGVQKYKKNIQSISKEQPSPQVSLEEASSNIGNYDKVFWIHTDYTPREQGVEVIADSLGVDKDRISIPKAKTVGKLLSSQEIPEELNEELKGSKKSLLVCMAGNTSLMAVKVLAQKGITSQSLKGGITELPQAKQKPMPELIKAATE